MIAALANAVQALGRGFDVTADARLLYCKGSPGSRLVVLDDTRAGSLVFVDGGSGWQNPLPGVPSGVKISKGSHRREHSRVFSFHQDIAVTFRRRDGDDLVQTHMDWVSSIYSAPDVQTYIWSKNHPQRSYYISWNFKYRVWFPLPVNIPGHQRKEPVSPSLQFSITDQVSVGRKPVTGPRLNIIGSKQNRLAIHLQHLASLPKILLPRRDSHIAIDPHKWQGPEEQDSRWFAPSVSSPGSSCFLKSPIERQARCGIIVHHLLRHKNNPLLHPGTSPSFPRLGTYDRDVERATRYSRALVGYRGKVRSRQREDRLMRDLFLVKLLSHGVPP